MNISFPATSQSEQEANTKGDEDQEATAQAEFAAPSSPPPRLTSTSFHLASQISNLATKLEIAHLRQFMVEQFHILQATILSKLDSIDSRLQTCEAQLLHHIRASPIPSPSHDPKGKAPMVSAIPSPTTSPHPSPRLSPAPTPHIPLHCHLLPLKSLHHMTPSSFHPDPPLPPHPHPHPTPTRSNLNLLLAHHPLILNPTP